MAASAGKRRRFKARFKDRVAVEAVRERKTLAQLPGQYRSIPTQLGRA
ncbi:MAG: hypothetical protein JJU36_08055 [Phycisphaeraceae bacterium]|nr:hypothetical protein [Phycisphaeraceae bacterium]